MQHKHLLLAGASGVVGFAAHDAFHQAGWQITTLGRSPHSPHASPHLSADLTSADDLSRHHKALESVTHIFYAALRQDPDPGVEADVNALMFENLIAAVRASGSALKHIIFVQGGKVYGAHLGVYRTPAREEDSRHFPPNLYFRHEDYARKLGDETGIGWTALRPDIVIGHSFGSPMNLGNLLGVYGTLCRETGTALHFPGPDAAWRNTLVNITDSRILGQSAIWAAENSRYGAFNITNGDVFRWSHVWPKLAEWFGVPVGEAQPISLSERLHALKPLWASIADKAQLQERDIDRLALGGFGDFIFHVEKDAIFDVTKARQHGFDAMTKRSDEVLIAHLEAMRSGRLIP
ncbi:MAG: SDR family oxidoreductase [Pantoea sp.]|uniref:SDR family oxidoreductase n=1 Tax=Pantoea TaxID=53335 RepID=UPI0006612CE5|nr:MULTISPECIES: SDR family oxidoreductase [Pantoea]MBS6438785.1 SDR family oxidoreductase [Pantoea sp.]MDU6078159.1 SDR family oxidoreductase [Pantoea sp.]MDU7840812.1 SDR family oxidoreductase [Pantoea sp.]HAB25451.1 nucleoside-diphosphate sugar epimerase [Pantoea sp.]